MQSGLLLYANEVVGFRYTYYIFNEEAEPAY